MKNMKKDFDIIKKKYGESFAKMCRTYFPTILQDEGILPRILEEHFAPTKSLFDDIINSKSEDSFKAYIFNFYNRNKTDYSSVSIESPEELMKKAGYTLYKCETDEDVKSFMKYYEEDEELCTFRDEDRINTHTIFFAVKDNVDKIKRENFTSPKRQDEYGTSVISLQFSKGMQSILSIKNRYNHTVDHCDATFSNDLENIIAGLTDSFKKYYGITLLDGNNKLYLPGYVQASDGKFYRYNYERENEYYCENNVKITTKGAVLHYDKSKYELIDYYLIGKHNKTIHCYFDGLPELITRGMKGNIKSIDVAYSEDKSQKYITFTRLDGSQTILTANKNNQMTVLTDDTTTTIPSNTVINQSYLEEINLPNCKDIQYNSFVNANQLQTLNAPKLETIGFGSFKKCHSLQQIDLPSIKAIESNCFSETPNLTSLNMPNIETISNDCFSDIREIKLINLPKIESIGNMSFGVCNSLSSIECPNLNNLGYRSFYITPKIKTLSLPSLRWIKTQCFKKANSLEKLYLNSCVHIEEDTFVKSNNLQSIYAPELECFATQPAYGIYKNLTHLYIPKLEDATFFTHAYVEKTPYEHVVCLADNKEYFSHLMSKDGLLETANNSKTKEFIQ